MLNTIEPGGDKHCMQRYGPVGIVDDMRENGALEKLHKARPI